MAIINALKSFGHDVDVCGYVRSDDNNQSLVHEWPVGVRHIETKAAGLEALGWFLRALSGSKPYTVCKYFSREYQELVRRLAGQKKYALCVIDHVQIGWILKVLPANLPIVLVAHNVEKDIYATQVDDSRNLFKKKILSREQRLIDKLERSIAAKASQIWTLSSADSTYFSLLGGGTVFSFDVPSAFELPDSGLVPFERDIGILGTWTWGPNALGLKWFFADVYPKLPKDLRIQVAGNGAGWLKNQYTNVDYLGFVNDAAEFLKSSRVVAIPSTQGGGIQIKTLDAIASGTLAVATDVAVRGIENPPPSVVVADNSEEFTRGLLRSLDCSERAKKSLSSRRWSENRQSNFLREIECSLKTFETTI